MLPRVALRAAALRTAPSTSTPRAIPTAWSRNYAHFNKPPVPPKKPSSGSSINSAYQAPNKAGSQRLTDSIRGAKERPERTDREELEDADIKESGEFNTKATPEQNAAPKSQPGPDVANATAPKTSRTAQSNRMQEEFEGPKSAEENTAPSSQPKQAPQESSEAAQEAAPETPRKPLPDLRQGIPSTFAEEFLKDQKPREPESTEAERDTAKIAEEVASAREREQQQRAEEGEAAGEASAGGGGRQGGDLPRSAYETSTDRRRNRVMNWVYAWFALTGSAGALWLGRNWETEEEEKRYPDAPSGFHLGHFWARIKARINDSMGYYTEPTFPKLLPEMDPPAPYTLVLSLEDLMIHSEWTRQHGYRTAKRPGLDYFLRYLSQYYEIVMFTSLPMAQAEPVYRKLDPYHIIMWPLFREGTRYYKGEYIKDLSYLNRDLSKVIVLDTKAGHVQSQPENAIVLNPWKGDPKDRELVAYVPFLESIAAMTVPDVRKVLASFDGKHIPTEYAAREARAREQFNKQLAEERARKPRHSLGAALSKSLGVKATPQPGQMLISDDGQTLADGFERGLMLSDQIRERGRKNYEQLERQIREEGDKWLKEMEEAEKQAQEEFSKNMKTGFVGFFGAKPQAPPPTQEQLEDRAERR